MDNAHAHPHPLSRRSGPAPISSRLRKDPRDQNADASSLSPSARQQRLLRTRNARFTAKKLSISGIGSRFTQLIKANEPTPTTQPTPSRNQENTVHQDQFPASYSAQSLGILEEITNSISVKNKVASKQNPVPVFQDTPERALLDESPEYSPYYDPSSLVNSPAPFDHIKDSFNNMGLREISGNARKSSPLDSSPFVISAKAARRRQSAQKSRFNSEEYIEHIERELELVKGAVYSPNTNRPWKEKLKVAKAENERLRKEMNDVRAAFEAEVQKTVEHMTTTEVDLRRKIRALEDDLEQKEITIQNLECEHDERRLDQSTFETFKATIEKLETHKANLEQDNQSISRRNEVLTQLLAMSPTKTRLDIDLSSPVRPNGKPRPKSIIIPRMPSSPGGSFVRRPQSVVASPSAVASCYFSPRQSTMSTPTHRLSTDLATEASLARSLRRSLTGSISRSSTTTDDADMSPSLLDLQNSSVDQPVKHNPKRRTRRFLQGSTQLKPLLLPTLTGENGVLSSASTTSPVHSRWREVSEESVDPTTTFLSKSPTEAEPQLDLSPSGHDSDSLTTQNSRQLAYQSLQGILDEQNVIDSSVAGLPTTWNSYALPSGNIDMSVEEMWADSQTDVLGEWIQSPTQDQDDDFDLTILPPNPHRSSFGEPEDELGLGLQSSPSPVARQSSIEVPEPLFSPVSRQKAARYFVTANTKRRIAPPQTVNSVARPATRIPRKRRKLSDSSQQSEVEDCVGLAARSVLDQSVGVEEGFSSQQKSSPAHSRTSSSARLSLTSPSKTKSPLEILQQRNIGGRPLAATTIKIIYGTLSRYTTYVKEIRRDPLALSRRVIANAWRTHWGILGRLSWWVLGLFLGPSIKEQGNRGWDWEWDDYDAESIADRQCRRRSREIDGRHVPLLLPAESHSPERHVRFEEQHDSYRTRGSRSHARPALKKKAGWGESLLLWGKFSVALLLAVGGAVVKGPGKMMRDTGETSSATRRGRGAAMTQEFPSNDANRKVLDEHAFPHSGPSEGAAMSESPLRRKNRSPSPPPSARMLLRSSQTVATPQMSSSPAFEFGHNDVFEFSSPCQPHDWADVGLEHDGSANRRSEEEMKTLKPTKLERRGMEGIFPGPDGIQDGHREYNPESAGEGLVFFQRLEDVAIADPGLRDTG